MTSTASKRFILRIDNGTIKSGSRCVDEPRYTYLKAESKDVDFITSDKKQAKVYNENDEAHVHSPDWKFIQIR